TIPDISQSLGLSQSRVGSLIFFVTAAQFVVALCAGFAMGTLGRKRMWMLCLAAAAVFTGLTYFVESFWQLTIMRMLASAFAMAELAVSITLVNEQVPARRRGLLYQFTNGTWSGAGYAYQAESFPTRVRGAAVGFLGAMMAGGLRSARRC